MAEMLIQSENLVAIADKIRVLSGTEDAMSLDDMANEVGNANDNVDNQADLIAQIKSTVDSLPEASGGVGYDTCTVNITTPSDTGGVAYLTVNADGELEPAVKTSATSYNIDCVCNSFIAVDADDRWFCESTNANRLTSLSSTKVFVVTASSGETATITFVDMSSGDY